MILIQNAKLQYIEQTKLHHGIESTIESTDVTQELQRAVVIPFKHGLIQSGLNFKLEQKSAKIVLW